MNRILTRPHFSTCTSNTVDTSRIMCLFSTYRTRRCLAHCVLVVTVPSSWKCSPDNVRNCQSYTTFLSTLKTYCFNTILYDLIIC